MKYLFVLAMLSLLLIACNENDSTDTQTTAVITNELWVLNNTNDQVSIVNQTDGSLLYQFSAPGGISDIDSNLGLAWDGQFIWIYHSTSNTLFKCVIPE